MIPNADQPAFHTWRWQVTKNFGLPADDATEELWLDLPEETRQSYRQGAAGVSSVLNYLSRKLDDIEIDSGSEHFKYGQETMLDAIKMIVRETREETRGDADWSTP